MELEKISPRPATDTLNLKLASPPGLENWRFLTHFLPRSLAMRELMRLRALYELGTLEMPTLDVGCGDGLFWENLLHCLDAKTTPNLSGLLGIDISPSELHLASIRLKERGGQVLQSDITAPKGLQKQRKFRTVIANCSLEHVSRIEPALANIRDMLEPDGTFLLFVPAPRWTDTLRLKRLFGRLSPRLGGLIGGCFDGFFQHRHLYNSSVWSFLLSGLGFEVAQVIGVGSAAGNRIFERNLPTATFAFLWKCFFGSYPSFGRSRSRGPSPLIQEFLRDIEEGRMLTPDLDNPEVVEYFIVCRKKAIIAAESKNTRSPL